MATVRLAIVASRRLLRLSLRALRSTRSQYTANNQQQTPAKKLERAMGIEPTTFSLGS